MYAHSDYKYPMHDGRVLDLDYIQEKKKRRNNLPKPKVKGAK
jgi:hypothetical protein